MIPILCKSLDSAIKQSSGFEVARLSDSLECRVQETLNGAFVASLKYPVGGQDWDRLDVGMAILVPPRPGTETEAFEIDSVTSVLDGEVHVTAHAAVENMENIMVAGFNAANAPQFVERLNRVDASGFKVYAIDSPFKFYTDFSPYPPGVFNPSYAQAGKPPRNLRDVVAGRKSSFLAELGGEIQAKGYEIKLLQRRGEDRGVTIEYGKNLMALSQAREIRTYASAGYPFWQKKTASGTEYMELPEKVLYYGAEDYTDVYRTEPIDLSQWFETKPTAAQLRSAAEEWIGKNWQGAPAYGLHLSFVDLAQTTEGPEPGQLTTVRLGDTITVRCPIFGIDAKVRVVRTKYDSLRNRYISVDVGDLLPDFADTILTKRG